MRSTLKDNVSRDFFHFLEQEAQLPVIRNGLPHFGELLLSQGDRDSLGRDFASPLVTGAATFALSAILYGTLAD